MADIEPKTTKAPWPYSAGIPQRFSARYERYQQLGGLVDIAEDGRAYAGDEPIRDVERFVFLSLVFDQIHKEGLEGDFAELGVYQGSTAAVLARHARRLNRRIHLLDTYEGFRAEDFSGLDAGRRAAFTDTSLEAVRARVGEENTNYIKGYFPQTAEQLPPDGRYCLVHIDTDLYAPIMAGLEYFYPRMVPGGFLIIHDYGSLVWEGAEKAIDTFFADKPESVIPIPDSSGSAVIRRLREPGAAPSWVARRQVLAMDVWHSAANGQLSNILADGWSSPEPWGTWGVGDVHRIRLTAAIAPGESVAVDLDGHAFVWDPDAGRTMSVYVNGAPFTEITFSKAQNFASLVLEPVLAADDHGTITIELRPWNVTIPRDVDPAIQETRTLGFGLHRIRVRALKPL